MKHVNYIRKQHTNIFLYVENNKITTDQAVMFHTKYPKDLINAKITFTKN